MILQQVVLIQYLFILAGIQNCSDALFIFQSNYQIVLTFLLLFDGDGELGILYEADAV